MMIVRIFFHTVQCFTSCDLSHVHLIICLSDNLFFQPFVMYFFLFLFAFVISYSLLLKCNFTIAFFFLLFLLNRITMNGFSWNSSRYSLRYFFYYLLFFFFFAFYIFLILFSSFKNFKIPQFASFKTGLTTEELKYVFLYYYYFLFFLILKLINVISFSFSWVMVVYFFIIFHS